MKSLEVIGYSTLTNNTLYLSDGRNLSFVHVTASLQELETLCLGIAPRYKNIDEVKRLNPHLK